MVFLSSNVYAFEVVSPAFNDGERIPKVHVCGNKGGKDISIPVKFNNIPEKTNFLALIIYFPFARISFFAEKIGFKVDNWPLSSYRKTSFYTMRTDSRDRFGTPLEQRFSRSEILAMMQASGLHEISFSNSFPFLGCRRKKKILKL